VPGVCQGGPRRDGNPDEGLTTTTYLRYAVMGPIRPHKSTRARRGRSVRSSPRSQTKPTSRRGAAAPRREPAAKRSMAAKPPDLDAILDAFSEAFDLIQAGHMAQKDAPHAGPPEVALRKGIAEMNRVYNDLDRATIELAGFCRKQAKTGRGRS